MTVFADMAKGVMDGIVRPVLDKFVPDAKDRLEAENMIWVNLHQINLSQTEVNKTEAANSDRFVSGWRPFVGWVCGANFAYAIIGNDLLNWGLEMASLFAEKSLPHLPEPDLTLTFELLLGLLGLAGYRTYEKVKGIPT